MRDIFRNILLYVYTFFIVCISSIVGIAFYCLIHNIDFVVFVVLIAIFMIISQPIFYIWEKIVKKNGGWIDDREKIN